MFTSNSSSRFGSTVETLRRTISAALVLLVIFPAALTNANPRSSQGNQEPGAVDGKVCAASGEPIAGALVTLLGKQGEKESETTTNADGSFVLLKAGQGTYALQAQKAGWKPRVVDSIRLGAGEKKHVDIVLESLAGSVAASANKGGPEREELKFSDEPDFAVAGVTDWSAAGLHGSAANVRTSEALAKETAALKSATGEARSASASQADAHRLSGDAKERNGDPLGAVNEYEKAARMDPSEENYFSWGTELLLHRASAAAIEVFARGTREHANSARMLAGLGASYYANGQDMEAARRVCEASDLRPLEIEPYLLLGKMGEAAAEPSPCSGEKLGRFVDQQPENAQANYYYGVLLFKEGRKSQNGATLERAEALFRKAVTIDPGFGEAYVQLGLMIAARGDLQQALRMYQKAVLASPKLGVAHYQLSLAYRRDGEMAKAEHELAVYKEIEHAEATKRQSERRELRQFVTILKEAPATSTPH